MEPAIYRHFLNLIPGMPLAFLTIIILNGCGGKVLTYEQQLLGEADSLFKAGNYEFAKIRFDKIRTLKPESPAAKIAIYYLGYINVYYDNPFASWEAALREFRLYVTLYPDDSRVDEINSWIKLLVVMQSFKRNYIGTTDSISTLKLEKFMSDRAAKNTVPVDSILSLNEVLRKCGHVRDSLIRKNKDLENFIIDLERKCQEAIQ